MARAFSDPPASLSFCFYVSRALISVAELKAIIEKSRLSNAKLDLTGGMVFTGKFIAQVLEGPSQAVDQTIAKIATDPRHEQFTRIAGGKVLSRSYPKWRMGYVNAPAADELVSKLIDGSLDTDKALEIRALLLEWIAGGT